MHAWACWGQRVNLQRVVRVVRSQAGRRLVRAVLAAWHGVARRRVLLLGLVSEQRASGQRRALVRAFSSWRAHIVSRRGKLRTLRMAVQHRHRRLLRSTFRTWQHTAEHVALLKQQERGMQAYRGAVGAALRWYGLSRALQRQQVLVDRAVRMYAHRVVAATQRAVLQAWAGLAAGERDRRRSAASVFCQAFAVIARERALAWAFRTWVGACARSAKAATKELVQQLQQARLEAAVGLEQLHRARAEGEGLLVQLEESEGLAGALGIDLKQGRDEAKGLRKEIEEGRSREEVRLGSGGEVSVSGELVTQVVFMPCMVCHFHLQSG